MSFEEDVALWAKRNRINSRTFVVAAAWAIGAAVFLWWFLWSLELRLTLPFWGLIGFVGVLTFVLYVLVGAPKLAADARAHEFSQKILEENLEKMARQFGTNSAVSVDDYQSTVRFERDNIVFDGEIHTQISDSVKRYTFNAGFNARSAPQIFYIQPKSFFAGEFVGCRRFLKPELLEDYELHSSDENFLIRLLSDQKLLKDLSYYPTSQANRIKIAFENGRFAISWFYGERIELEQKGEILAECLKQIMETAVLFHERIKNSVVA